jgi:hypothetical protein
MTTLTAQDVERLAVLCEKAIGKESHEHQEWWDFVDATRDPQTILALCRHYLDTAARGQGDDAVLANDCRVGHGVIKAGCKVSTLIGAAERAQEYYLKYGDFPTAPAGDDAAVVMDAEVSAVQMELRDVFEKSGTDLDEAPSRIRAALEAAERVRVSGAKD